MPLLDKATVEEKLKSLKDWALENGEIVTTRTFGDFAQAMRFVNEVAELADAAGHHPDIDIRYNKVRLALASHDVGGLTNRDFEVAAAIGEIPAVN